MAIFDALTTTTWSPVSAFGVKIGLCLPRSSVATSVARRPSTRPSASMTCHPRVISELVGVYVRTGSPSDVDSKTRTGTAHGGALGPAHRTRRHRSGGPPD